MPRDDWYRNTHWDAEVEARFFEKLARARRKSQYLRVQACELVGSHPVVALSLLEKYFELGEHFGDASAYLDQSRAYRALGKTNDAIQSLQKALRRQREFPNLKTMAWSDFALLVATEKLGALYGEALEVLEERPQ